jgi:hypothetical protein
MFSHQLRSPSGSALYFSSTSHKSLMNASIICIPNANEVSPSKLQLLLGACLPRRINKYSVVMLDVFSLG